MFDILSMSQGGPKVIEQQVKLQIAQGMDTEIATRFVQIASKFNSRILINYQDKEVNAKSIMSVLTLAIPPEDELTLRVKGEDEKAAFEALVRFISTGEGITYPLGKMN